MSGFPIKFKNLGNSFFPKTITLANHDDYNFEGMVEFDSIGVREITNYEEYTGNTKSFAIDTENILGPIEFIHFYEIEISIHSMTGKYALAGSTLDSDYHFIHAIRQ